MLCPFSGGPCLAQCQLYEPSAGSCAFERIANSLVILSKNLKDPKQR